MENTTSNPPELPREVSLTGRIFSSVVFKIIVVFILMMVLLIPLSWVNSLIEERNYREQQVSSEISSKWGKDQVISGPILAVPYETFREVKEKDNKGKEKTVIYKDEAWFFMLPKKSDMKTAVSPEYLKRGIYQSVVYNSDIEITSSFDRANFEDLSISESSLRWADSRVVFGVEDLKGLLELPKIVWNDSTLKTTTNDKTLALFAQNLVAKVPLTVDSRGKASFKIAMTIRGSKSLNFFPLADQTNIIVNGNWANPSFSGGYLPESRDVQDTAFHASWNIPSFNRKLPAQWNGSSSKLYNFYRTPLNDSGTEVVSTADVLESQMSSSYSSIVRTSSIDDMVQINFLPEVNNYQKTTRVAKYGLLVIALTFISLFFTEVIKKKHVHIIQYVLIGAAMVLFYSLLLAIAEHLGFNIAYLLAALATTFLVTSFVRAITKDRKTAMVFGSILSLFYIFIYVLMQLRDYSLIVGTVGVFIILAILMRLSVKINWYQFDKR